MAANNYLTVRRRHCRSFGTFVDANYVPIHEQTARRYSLENHRSLLRGATKKDSAEEMRMKNRKNPSIYRIIKVAKRVIIVPGYGMALAQAQHLVSRLSEALEKKGATVDFAIHPVAGRMPGHMNVLLAEANVPYEKLKEMDDINPEFANCDLAIVVGANDVINPAANTAEGTPIYGMPVLNVEQAKHIVICNYDLNPGYAGVENALYKKKNVIMKLGDAKETVSMLIDLI